MAALPAFQELSRAARSAEKLFDTLNRELPPTLEAIRLTSVELTNLTDDVGQNVQAAGRVVGQLDQSIASVKQQARQAQVATQSFAVGLKAAWQAFRRPDASLYALQNQADQTGKWTQDELGAEPDLDDPKLTASSAFEVDTPFTENRFDDETLTSEPPHQEQRFQLEPPNPVQQSRPQPRL
jgi:hypothetical protein